MDEAMNALSAPDSGRAGLAALATALLLLAVAPQSARAQPQMQAVGMVERIDLRSNFPQRVLIERGGAVARELELGEYVREKDIIRVPEADATVVISRRWQPLVICARGEVPARCVAKIDGSGGFIEAVPDLAMAYFRLLSGHSATNAVNMTSRGLSRPPRPSEQFQMSLGAGVPQTVRPGMRAIWLSWIGGRPPFHVSIFQGATDLGQINTESTEMSLSRTRLEPGKVRFEVHDALDRMIALEAEVSDDVPVSPDFSNNAPTADATRFLAAAWLAARDDRYLLEAAWQLSTVAPAFAPANALRSAFAAGETMGRTDRR